MATLAEVLRQAGYVTPQGQVVGPRTDLAQKLKSYVMNIPQNAAQNLANQRADIDAALTMGQGGIQIGDREAFARQMAEVPNLMGLTAYHGTPHTIKGKFDISKVGTGEGAQAYGHGMYFAEAPQVAETYRRAGGGLEVRYPKPLEELGINPKVATNSMDFDENPVNQALGRIAKGLRTTALDYPDVPIDQKLVKEHFDEYIRLLDDKLPAEAAQKKALQDLVSKEGYPEIGFGGNLYKVDIPDEYIPNMLDWDKPLSEQPKVVQNAFKSILNKEVSPQGLDIGGAKILDNRNRQIDPTQSKPWVMQSGDKYFGLDQKDVDQLISNETAKGLYGRLAADLGSQQAASEFLLNQGVKGIRYLDEVSRNATIPNLAKYQNKVSSLQAKFNSNPTEANKFMLEDAIQELESMNRQAKEITSNFVVFEPSNVKILEQNSKPLTRKEIIEQELEKVAK